MRELMFILFEQSHFGTGIKVTPFSASHFAYLTLIFGAMAVLYFRNRYKPMQTRERVVRGLVYVLMFSYFSDFFVQQFVFGGMTEEKLPFHVCIVTAVLMPVAQFNRNGNRILEPVAVLAVLSPLMYLGYPASVGEGEPWCYQTVQVMFFHGTQLIWGVLTLAFGFVRPVLKNCWKPGLLLVGITLWAKLGNLMYDRNFFFLEEDAFFIGLVAKGILPEWSLMILNPVIYFMAVLLLYGICHAIRIRPARKAVLKGNLV